MPDLLKIASLFVLLATILYVAASYEPSAWSALLLLVGGCALGLLLLGLGRLLEEVQRIREHLEREGRGEYSELSQKPEINQTSPDMSNPQKDALEMVADLIRDLHLDNTAPEEPAFSFLFSSQEEGTVFLDEEEARSYRQCLQKLMDAFAKKEDISARTVETAFQEAIFHSIDLRSKRVNTPFEHRIKEAISKLKERLTIEKKTYRTYIPIQGVSLTDLPFDLGDVQFMIYHDPELSALNDRRVPEHFLSQVESQLYGKTCAAVDIEARDATAAQALAIKRLRLVIDVINFFSGLMPPRRAWIYLRGDCEPARFLLPSMEVGGERYHLSTEDVGPYLNLSLSSLLAFDDEYHVGLRHVLSILGKEQSEMEERLIAALQWAGRATIESRREEAFLLFAIALESVILVEGDPVELTYRLKIRIAHLLGKDLNSRLEVARTVGKLYGIRSKIVHNGDYQVTDVDLNTIRSIAQKCIVRLCREDGFKGMSGPEELVAWFDKQVLS